MHCLKFGSRERIYGLTSPCEAFSTSIGPFQVYEVFRPDVHGDIRPGLGAYSVMLEAQVETLDSLQQLYQEGITLCEEFEPAWLYVWGTPLHGFGWDLEIEELVPPKGWSTTYRGIQREMNLARSGLCATIELESIRWMHGPRLPLESALRIREKISLSSDVLQTLVRFHYQAHAETTMEAGVFFLCKGLEIVRKMLPGKATRQDRVLPSEVRGILTQPLHQLSGTANSYLETRHALQTKGSSLSLHPSLGGGLLDFVKDVDLVLRTVVCIQLQEEPVLLRKQRR
jgi:hypothetical protein